jgi:hypothetical protein
LPFYFLFLFGAMGHDRTNASISLVRMRRLVPQQRTVNAPVSMPSASSRAYDRPMAAAACEGDSASKTFGGVVVRGMEVCTSVILSVYYRADESSEQPASYCGEVFE